MLSEMVEHNCKNTVGFPGLISVGRIQVAREGTELWAIWQRIQVRLRGPITLIPYKQHEFRQR